MRWNYKTLQRRSLPAAVPVSDAVLRNRPNELTLSVGPLITGLAVTLFAAPGVIAEPAIWAGGNTATRAAASVVQVEGLDIEESSILEGILSDYKDAFRRLATR